MNTADKASHDHMVALVEQMLALHQHLAAAKSQPRTGRLIGWCTSYITSQMKNFGLSKGTEPPRFLKFILAFLVSWRLF